MPGKGRDIMEQTETARTRLLDAEGAPVPLLGVTARAEIRDYACRVVLSQRFRNVEDRPIEAVYKFPLDEGAAVCGFEVEIDGRRIRGRVEEREKAFETYDEAVAAGHGGYLLDEERADIFTASVGNLPPGKEAVLRLTTVSELPLEGEKIRFTLPTAIAPRYAPAADRQGVGETEAERVAPPYALEVPYGLTLDVDVRMSVPVRSVESPSHPVKVAIGDGHATVSLSAREAALDRDVVLTIELAETHEPRTLVERGPDGAAYALVSFRPSLPAVHPQAEVIFVVDCSGSMMGTSIAEARNALQLALRSLRPGCLFNIVSFGSTFTSLFSESRAYDEGSLAEAATHVDGMDGNMGGTEILPALEHVLDAARRPGLPRQVFVLTDGEISNTDAVVALARRHAGHARVFTFGIGSGASRHLVKGLARAGEGEAEFIAPGERMEAKVLRQFSRALSPALADVGIDWGALAATQAPHEVPPVFAGGRVVVFGRIESPRPATVTLRAVGPDGAVAASTSLDPESAPEGTLVGTLWARRTIRDLEEGRSARHPRRGSQQPRAQALNDEQVKADIVRLGTTWSLVSRHTSFVAVEERETPVEGEAALRRVPVAITKGWHGLDGPSYVASRCAPQILSGPLDAGVLSSRSMLDTGAFSLSGVEGSLYDEGDTGDMPSAARVEPLRGQPPGVFRRAIRPLDELVALQRADGSWALDDALARVQGWRDSTTLRRALGRALASEAEERAAATAFALVWLEREAADLEDEWRLLADKAREWLARTPEGADFWMGLARRASAANWRIERISE